MNLGRFRLPRWVWLPVLMAQGLLGCNTSLGPTSEREIAGAVEFGPAWLELRPDPPLRAEKVGQKVLIKVPDAARWEPTVDGGLVDAGGGRVRIDV